MKVEYIAHSGTDLTVVNAARVSFDKESAALDHTGVYDVPVLAPRDTKLIRHLASHNHFTPFTHCTITLRETVPIFVARQRFKHTVGFSYNEVSRRYVDDEPTFYTPDAWRKRAENKKQGSSDKTITILRSRMHGDQTVNDAYLRLIYHAEELYNEMIEVGVAPEQARMVLPQSMYTSYYVTGSLAAFVRAYNLRTSEDAQMEIRQLATHWGDIIYPFYPVSWRALTSNDCV